jgi:sulfite exporter TauE/SafE
MKFIYYAFRILSYAAGTGALVCYLGGPGLRDWMYGLVGVSFACFVVAMLLMVGLRLRRRSEG